MAYKSANIEILCMGTEAWFCGKDIAIVLGYKDTRSALLDHVDDEDKCRLEDIVKQRGGNLQPLQGELKKQAKKVFINESGLYSLILRSKLETAKEFKKWVTSEVLPSIRKTGEYKVNEQLKKIESEKNEIEEKYNNLTKYIMKKQKSQFTCGKLLYIVTNEDLKDRFKFGYTDNMNRRLSEYMQNNPGKYNVEKLWYTSENINIEKLVKSVFYKHRIGKWVENTIKEKFINYVDNIVNTTQLFDISNIDENTDDNIIEESDPYKLLELRKNKYPNGKKCSHCQAVLSINNFYPKTPNSINLREKCKECMSKIAKERKEKIKKNPLIDKKECENCKELLPGSMFYKSKVSEEFDGLWNICISCYTTEHNIIGQVKQCAKCLEVKPFSEFQKDKTHSDGYRSSCKNCRNKNCRNSNENFVINRMKIKEFFYNNLDENLDSIYPGKILTIEQIKERAECIAIKYNLDLKNISNLKYPESRAPKSTWCEWIENLMKICKE